MWWSLQAEGKSLLHSNQYRASCMASWLLWHPTVAVRGWHCGLLGFFLFVSDFNKVIICLWGFDLNWFSSFYDDDNTPKLASGNEASAYIVLAPEEKCTGGGGGCYSLEINADENAVLWMNWICVLWGFKCRSEAERQREVKQDQGLFSLKYVVKEDRHSPANVRSAKAMTFIIPRWS